MSPSITHKLYRAINMPRYFFGVVMLLVLIAGPFPGVSNSAHAADTNLKTQCASMVQSPEVRPGEAIVKAVFASISSILDKIGKTAYNGIIGNDTFKNIVAGVLSAYIALYGAMVMLNLASARLGEVSGRLIRIAAVYALLSDTAILGIGGGWNLFYQFFGNLFMGGMNELLFDFAVAAGVPAIPPIAIVGVSALTPDPTLDPTAVSILYTAMNFVYKPFYLYAILGMSFLSIVGFIIALGMMWAFFDFTMMALGALVTYIKAIVGLTFLFGIAPIFIVFLLFQQTRQIFLGWVNQVLSFAIAPVLLFAFLSFYIILMNTVLQAIFKGVDFCWGTMMTVAGTTTEIKWWRPALWDDSIGKWVFKTGDWASLTGNPLPPAVSITNVLFFLLVAHLGKNFCVYIDQIAANLSDGIGPGVVRGTDVSKLIGNRITGGRGLGNVLRGGVTGPRTPSALPGFGK